MNHRKHFVSWTPLFSQILVLADTVYTDVKIKMSAYGLWTLRRNFRNGDIFKKSKGEGMWEGLSRPMDEKKRHHRKKGHPNIIMIKCFSARTIMKIGMFVFQKEDIRNHTSGRGRLFSSKFICWLFSQIFHHVFVPEYHKQLKSGRLYTLNCFFGLLSVSLGRTHCCSWALFVLSINDPLSPFLSQTVWLKPLQLCWGMSLMSGCKKHMRTCMRTRTSADTAVLQMQANWKTRFSLLREGNFKGSLMVEKG